MGQTKTPPKPVVMQKNAAKPAVASQPETGTRQLSLAFEQFQPNPDLTKRGDYRTAEEVSAGSDPKTYFDGSKSDFNGKLMKHIYQKLTHTKGLEELWISPYAYDGPLPDYNNPKATDLDKKKAADEAWARAVTEVFCYAAYGGLAISYSLSSDAALTGRILEEKDPAAPIIVACQHLATYVAFTRTFVGSNTYDGKFCLAASYGSKTCVETSMKGTYVPIGTNDAMNNAGIRGYHDKQEAAMKVWKVKLDAYQKWVAHKEDWDPDQPAPPQPGKPPELMVKVPMFDLSSDDRNWYKVSWASDPTQNKQKVGIGPGTCYVFNNLGPNPPVPDQPSAHVGSVLRMFPPNRAQTMDTGVMMEGAGGTHDEHTADHGVYETLPGGMLSDKLIGVGIAPDVAHADLNDYVQNKLMKSRPVGCARFILTKKHPAESADDIVFISPMLLPYGSKDTENFYPTRLKWSLRDLPGGDQRTAYWVLYLPDSNSTSAKPMSTVMWDSATGRATALNLIIEKAKPLAKFPDKFNPAFMVVMALRSQPGGTTALERFNVLSNQSDNVAKHVLGRYLGWLLTARNWNDKGAPPFLPWNAGFGAAPDGAPSYFSPSYGNPVTKLPVMPKAQPKTT